uniref:Ovule protein n=1 Tax=Heterorhabditis bacteriophora TaxID=37862 RepID=A0A1I7X4C8_HETBA
MGHSNRSGHLLMEPKQLLSCADSNSLDLNPTDFAIRSVLENKPSRTSYNHLDSVKVALVEY